LLTHTERLVMYTYQVWIRLNQYQTAHVHVTASDDNQAKLIAESQYGYGNVLNWTRIS
jgi:hypothetical protein